MSKRPDWAGASGDIWANRWRDTDRVLAPIGAVLDEAISAAAPAGRFRALDVGCGPGSTALALAERRPDAAIVGCDLSRALVAIAIERAAPHSNLRFVVGDAQAVAPADGPFDLIFSRHGVMFFDQPEEAFAALREGAAKGARLVFSCFQSWESNPWASELVDAAAGKPVPPPGREPGGFAFADAHYVAALLAAAGWIEANPRSFRFDYVAGNGAEALDQAVSFLTVLGPAARVIDSLQPEERESATRRVGAAIAGRLRDGRVVYPAAAWIWTAKAG